MEKVTVIIPNFNGMKFLRGCMEALYAQEPGTPPFRVVVVDNGSEDGSVDFLRTHFPQAKLEALPENTGFCHAVNVGIRMADTPYVILLNNDTKVKAGFIRALYEAIERRTDAFSVSAKMLMWDRPELIDDAGDRYCVLGWAFSRGKGKPADRYDTPCEVFSACGGASIYRRSVFGQIGYFDEAHFAYLEDLDIGYRAGLYGYRNYYEPAAQVIHFGSASTGSRYNEVKTKLAAANNIFVIGKNMPLLQRIWNLPFLLPGFFVKFLFFCRKGMGRLYLRGLREGFAKLYSPQGRAARVPFRGKNLANYIRLQLQLYSGLFFFFGKK